jgi:cephalosporin-C deacetylase
MPLTDMPLEKLKLYQGRNPKPADFESFWNRSIKEMKSIDPEIKTVPVKIPAKNADFFDLWFTGIGGARIYAKLLKPKKNTGKCPAVILFHGYSGNSGDWFDKLAWVSEGFIVAALDCRGQEGKSEDKGGVKGNTLSGHFIRGLLDDSPDKLLFRSIFLDCAQLAGIITSMPDVDKKKVYAVGGSQGGALTLACSALEPRISKCASIYPFLSDYKRVWEMDLATGAYAELKTFFRNFDPNHNRENEIFTRLGYIDIQHLAPRIKAETLMITGLMDTTCPPSTQFAVYNKIKAKKKMIIYPDFGHEPGMPSRTDHVFSFLNS